MSEDEGRCPKCIGKGSIYVGPRKVGLEGKWIEEGKPLMRTCGLCGGTGKWSYTADDTKEGKD